MTLTNKRSSILPVALAALLAVPVLAHVETAEADVRVRVRGTAKAKARVRVRTPRRVRAKRVRRARRARRARAHRRVRPRRVYRPYYGTPGYSVRLRLGGGIYWGPYYTRRYAAPPPAASYDCGPSVPAYYTPRTNATQRVVVGPSPAPLPELPRFAVGAFLGGVDASSSPGASDIGLLGRLRLTERLSLEAEVAKTEIENGTRIDRRLGGAMLFDLAPRSTWSLHLLGGAGVQQVEAGDRWRSTQEYAELGAGLTYRLSQNLHLSADLRAGARTPVEDAAPDALKAIAPSSDRQDGYTRGRLSAVLHF